MNAFDLCIGRENEIFRGTRTVDGRVVANCYGPGFSDGMARAPSDPLNQCGLTEIGQVAFATGHGPHRRPTGSVLLF